MFNVGDKVRIQTEKELIKRYAEKNKITPETAQIKIGNYCNRWARGLVMKKKEIPFKSREYCGVEGKIHSIRRCAGEETPITSFVVTVKVQRERWRGHNQEPELVWEELKVSVPPSCLSCTDFQLEFEF